MKKTTLFFLFALLTFTLAQEGQQEDTPAFEDNEERFQAIISRIFPEEDSTTDLETVKLALFEYGFNQEYATVLEHVEKIKAMDTEGQDPEVHEYLIKYLILVTYIDEQSNFIKFDKEEISQFLKLENVNIFTTNNYGLIIRKFIEIELDKMGIVDQEQREETLKAFGAQAALDMDQQVREETIDDL